MQSYLANDRSLPRDHLVAYPAESRVTWSGRVGVRGIVRMAEHDRHTSGAFVRRKL